MQPEDLLGGMPEVKSNIVWILQDTPDNKICFWVYLYLILKYEKSRGKAIDCQLEKI